MPPFLLDFVGDGGPRALFPSEGSIGSGSPGAGRRRKAAGGRRETWGRQNVLLGQNPRTGGEARIMDPGPGGLPHAGFSRPRPAC